MSAGRDDRLGGRSDSQESGRTDTGPIKRFADDDRGENPAEHLPGADPEVARRLAGADTGSLRSQERDKTDRGAGQKPGQGGRGGDDGPPIYEGATSTSAVGGLDAGMGSAGVSAGSGSPTGSQAAGGAGSPAPGVTSTTGAGYSTMTGSNRTGGPTPGRDDADRDTAQPPRSSER
jgi:translation initiation factor IF-2